MLKISLHHHHCLPTHTTWSNTETPRGTLWGLRGALFGTPSGGSCGVSVAAARLRHTAQRRRRPSCSGAPPLHAPAGRQNWNREGGCEIHTVIIYVQMIHHFGMLSGKYTSGNAEKVRTCESILTHIVQRVAMATRYVQGRLIDYVYRLSGNTNTTWLHCV